MEAGPGSGALGPSLSWGGFGAGCGLRRGRGASQGQAHLGPPLGLDERLQLGDPVDAQGGVVGVRHRGGAGAEKKIVKRESFVEAE